MKPSRYSISKDFRFEASHRLVEPYIGKCSHLHGHSWKITVSVCADDLNAVGFVRDFSELKPIRDWLDGALDHATLVADRDEELLRWLAANDQKHFIVPHNPTSEILAKVIFEKATALGFQPSTVTVQETCTCSATYHAL